MIHQTPSHPRLLGTLQLRIEASQVWRTHSPNLDRCGSRKLLNRQHTWKNKYPPPGWTLVVYQLVFPRTLKIRFITGGYSSTGPKCLGSLWRKQQWTRPLREETKTGLCGSSLMLKYLSFALRTAGSFTRSLMGWFQPHVSRGLARGFQTVFFLA